MSNLVCRSCKGRLPEMVDCTSCNGTGLEADMGFVLVIFAVLSAAIVVALILLILFGR